MRRLLSNVLIALGLSLAPLRLGLGVFLVLLEVVGHQQHPYMGILTFGLLPLGAILTLAMAAVGWAIRHRDRVFKLPVVNLNEPRMVRLVVGLLFAVLLIVSGTAFGSYQAYEYTDSTRFCGLTCHQVMQPEYSAHETSPHARVACVECHVGSGAQWYVQAKVNGMKQCYEMLTHRWPAPIPVPVKNLRPAQDTCEKCHWARKDWGDVRKTYTYYQSDDKNTRQDMVMLLHVGGGEHGIHFHMNVNNTVTYATLDPKRMDIPWVKVVSKDGGTVRIYRNKGSKFTDADLPRAEMRTMDCTDCHNRATHVFHPAPPMVDEALAQGRISDTLPNIKDVGTTALEATGYKSQDDGVAGIETAVRKFYQEKHPEVLQSRGAEVSAAIAALQDIYRRNYFPEMKADWRAFPSHVDHTYSTGCFRCHDDQHKSDDGKVLSRDCKTCHTIVYQKAGGQAETNLSGLEFKHPGEGDGWKDSDCTDCHGPSASK